MVKTKEFNISERIPELWDLLSDEDKALVGDRQQIYEYKKNELIYSESEAPKNLMCILSGKAKIYKSGAGGRDQILRMAMPGEYFGYRAFFADEAYVTSAVACETCTIFTIPMTIVQEITERNSRLAMLFIKLLATDLGKSDERIVNLTQKHLRGRLAESLIFLLDNYGLEKDGATISIYLTREDIASLSNMTTSNAIRTLSGFVNEHLITMDGRKIKIMDEPRLRKISRLG